LHGKIIDQEARLEIVRAIEKKMDAAEEVCGVLRAEVGDDALEGNAGIDGAELVFRGNRFGQGLFGVRFIEKCLALKVGRLDEVAVDNPKKADTRAHQKVRSRCANSAAADNGGTRGADFFLTLRADASKEHLARVFFLRRIVHA
jgi:hypothetical protein